MLIIMQTHRHMSMMQTHILTAKSVIKKQPMAVAISIIWPNTPTNHDRRDVRVVISNVCEPRIETTSDYL